ncbi:angiotensin-converting enzyme-like [Macrobrachium nipponense]|uniref:angiotensin-converting enzyme-like n=1 Tax=Macrobrachium nipponense TaxID=159736 RepID=UPI0030C83B0F
MAVIAILALTVVCIPGILAQTPDTSHVQVERQLIHNAAARLLREESSLLSKECTKVVHLLWEYNTNITAYNKEEMLKAQLNYAAVQKESWRRVQKWTKVRILLKDQYLERQFRELAVLGSTALPEEELRDYTRVITEMSTIYNTAKVCSYHDPSKCDLTLSKDLSEILKTSRDNEELKYIWKTWRDNSGKLIRQHYRDFIPMANKAAKINGFANQGDMDISAYETEGFRQEIAAVWEQLKPFYEQLHAYVRRKLREVYGEDVISERGPIPAHLLGNMWAQQWLVYDIASPYPNKVSLDVTPQMIEQGYTPKKMFELSDDFFASLNLTRMPDSFWKHSLLEHPGDREVNCHASAFDFCNGEDFRIKQCTKVNMVDLITAHHEMGHIQYYLQYKHLPYAFRNGGNPGFHEALGDTLALSVSTPKHLEKIGLLKEVQEDYEVDINFLLQMALSKIAFLPFAYAMDSWRWGLFDGSIPEKDWNCAWWDLRYEFQGIKPPLLRTEDDFDPGAKYHVASNRAYIGYFVSFIIQFQFHKALCLKAGQYDSEDPSKPLHKCDIYESVEAGNALGDMLQLGSSKHWKEAMSVLTGEEGKMDASVIREYFKPLEDWLREDNLKHGEFVGWRPDGQYCVYKAPSNSQ